MSLTLLSVTLVRDGIIKVKYQKYPEKPGWQSISSVDDMFSLRVPTDSRSIDLNKLSYFRFSKSSMG